MTTGSTARVLNGTHLSSLIKTDLTRRVAVLAEHGIFPGLGTVLVGDQASSRLYVNGKHRDCREVGIRSIRIELPAGASPSRLMEAIDQLNTDRACTGFIVQLPLPPGIDTYAMLERIHPRKDADGLHPANLGRLVLGTAGPLPCTPRGIIELLRYHDIELTGSQVCVIGCGLTVGRPLSLMLTHKTTHATVTLCNEATPNVAAHTRIADVVVAAAGVAHLVRPSWVRPGAAVLSVGLTRTVEGVLGDVHPDVREVASHVAPPVGGVGPMTRAMLLTNVVDMAERELELLRRPGA
jgi:methylenetetrahydrofolate dehydrogenase (NADP+) / methenyltetrahydrofolate cyclohydrolase